MACGYDELDEDEGEVAVQDAELHEVGTDLSYLDDAKVGDTIRFYYGAGSEPGYRTVRVLKVDSGAVEGPTLERDPNDNYRRYSDEHASDITVVAQFALPGDAVEVVTPEVGADNTLRVRFDDAGTKLLASLTGEQLAELYAKHVMVVGESAKFDEQTGEVVVKLPEPPKLEEQAMNDHQGSILTFTLGKKTLRIHTYTKDKYGSNWGLHSDDADKPGAYFDTRHPTLADLHRELGRFLGK